MLHALSHPCGQQPLYVGYITPPFRYTRRAARAVLAKRGRKHRSHGGLSYEERIGFSHRSNLGNMSAIYCSAGKELQRQGSPASVYQRWIDTYASEEFATVVQEVIALIDRIAAPLTSEDRERVAEHFVMTSRCEYLFWDMGYRRATWDI